MSEPRETNWDDLEPEQIYYNDDFFDGSEEKQEREDLEDRGVMEHGPIHN